MSDLALSLQITLAGMGLVFGAIIVLWGLMALLTALVRDQQPQARPEEPAAVESQPAVHDLKARAAAAAVALAMAEQDASRAHPLQVPPTALIGAWQLGMRTRHMAQKGGMYKKEHR
jgi:Na+-transporting methylmalonyl-CoA/oxaloacetate decarboxylase gamma subunit